MWSDRQGINLQNIQMAQNSWKSRQCNHKTGGNLNRHTEDFQKAKKHVKRCSTSLIIKCKSKLQWGVFLGGSVIKNLPANAGDTVQSLVQEDPTCRRATKPMRHNYWTCALEPGNCSYCSPHWEATAMGSPCTATRESPQQRRPSMAKINEIMKEKTMKYHLIQSVWPSFSTNNKCWREKGTFLHCWWKCKLVQLLWKIVRRSLKKNKKINIELYMILQLQFCAYIQRKP